MSAALQAVGPAEQVPATHPVQTISESAAILQIIERAARDPAVDLGRLERLMAMRERAEARAAETAFASAMKAAQAEMGRVAADAVNPQTRSKYATYAALDRALRPIYTAHGFSLSFDEAESPKPEHIRVLCYVSHDGGHTRTYRKDMPADGKGPKGGDVMTKTHAAGAAASYGMRYLLKGIFNVAVGEDDRDGNTVKAKGDAVSEDQVMALREMIEATSTDIGRFCRHMGIDGLSDLPVAKFASAMALLKQKEARR